MLPARASAPEFDRRSVSALHLARRRGDSCQIEIMLLRVEVGRLIFGPLDSVKTPDPLTPPLRFPTWFDGGIPPSSGQISAQGGGVNPLGLLRGLTPLSRFPSVSYPKIAQTQTMSNFYQQLSRISIRKSCTAVLASALKDEW